MIEHGLKLVTTDDTENIVTQENDVVSEIRALIKKHNLEAGDKLPSERKLSEKLGVSRNQIRAGIQKLEFYGIIETLPQSGSIITGIGVPSMNTMMKDVLDLDTPDFNALVETRVLIESQAVQMAATRCTEESLKQLEMAHQNFVDCITNGLPSLIEDMKFPLVLLKASENSVLYGLMKIIVPDIIGHFYKEDVCDRTQAVKLISEHTDIIEAIKNKTSDDALEALNTHFITLQKYTIK